MFQDKTEQQPPIPLVYERDLSVPTFPAITSESTDISTLGAVEPLVGERPFPLCCERAPSISPETVQIPAYVTMLHIPLILSK